MGGVAFSGCWCVEREDKCDFRQIESRPITPISLKKNVMVSPAPPRYSDKLNKSDVDRADVSFASGDEKGRPSGLWMLSSWSHWAFALCILGLSYALPAIWYMITNSRIWLVAHPGYIQVFVAAMVGPAACIIAAWRSNASSSPADAAWKTSDCEDLSSAEFQIPVEAGVVSVDVWRRSSGVGGCALPVECAPLSLEQKMLYMKIRHLVSGLTYGELRRDKKRSLWLVEPDCHSKRSHDVVAFSPRDIVRIVLSVSACKAPNALETSCHWLQQIYALRFDHRMDQLELRLAISDDELKAARGVYPKAVYGESQPHGYPIMWDMVSALRLDKMKDAFGSVDAALDRILWYDLHIMELYDRYKLHLSATRGNVLLLKGISVIDLGAWSRDLLHPGILRTCIQIIARSGSIWPESVWRVYLINVPWAFMPLWAVIRKGCHPVTLEKLMIFSDKRTFLDHFQRDLGISAEQVPRENGGLGPSLVDLPVTPIAQRN